MIVVDREMHVIQWVRYNCSESIVKHKQDAMQVAFTVCIHAVYIVLNICISPIDLWQWYHITFQIQKYPSRHLQRERKSAKIIPIAWGRIFLKSISYPRQRKVKHNSLEYLSVFARCYSYTTMWPCGHWHDCVWSKALWGLVRSGCLILQHRVA